VEDEIGDITLILSESQEDTPPSIFEFGGDVQGANIIPKVKAGYDTMVYLVSQTIQDGVRERPIEALYTVNDEPSVQGNLDEPDTQRPPYDFKFTERINKHLVINDFRHLFRGSNGVGVYGVRSIFDGLIVPDMLPSRLEGLFVPLPWVVEVEGFPIKDSEKFHATIDELQDEYDQIMRKYSREMNSVWMDSKAGKLTPEEANKKMMDINKKWRAETQESMKKITKVTKDNPAFK